MCETEENKQRALSSTKRYLELLDYNIIADTSDTNLEPIKLVAEDTNNNSLVFVMIQLHDRFPKKEDYVKVDDETRVTLENAACKFLSDGQDYVDVILRFDIVDIFIIGDERAMLRHTIDCVNIH